MPPPPVFQALFLSFQVSLPGSPGAGMAYQRHSSLPVARVERREPAARALIAVAVRDQHLALGGDGRESQALLACRISLTTVIFLSQTISPRVAVERDHAAVGRVGDHQVFPQRDAARAAAGCLRGARRDRCTRRTRPCWAGARRSCRSPPQPSLVYMKPLSMSGLISASGPFWPTSCMPASASAQTMPHVLDVVAVDLGELGIALRAVVAVHA